MIPNRSVSVCLFARFLSLALCFFAMQASASPKTYLYRGKPFEQLEGVPGIFTFNDRVTASFTLNCEEAHSESDCRNLPYDDYLELGAIDPNSIEFNAGPAMLPTVDGGVMISRFMFSTDENADVFNWDIELFAEDQSQNIDTDNINGGTDSAAVPGGGAYVTGNPGDWGTTLLEDLANYDLVITKRADQHQLVDVLQPIEFTVSIMNDGPGKAENVVVTDLMPPELEIPRGLAAHTTTGYYDPQTGRWQVGELSSTMPERLTLPAAVKGSPETRCVVNRASIDGPGDIRSANDNAESVVRLPGSNGCIDLSVEAIQLSWPFDQKCPDRNFSIRYRFVVKGAIHGPVSNVVLEVSQSDYQAPDISSDHPNCSGTVCTWEILDSDVTVNFTTVPFTVDKAITHGLTAVVRSETEDYALENNTTTYRVEVTSSIANCKNPPSRGGFDFGGYGGGCFIATAVYDSYSHPSVVTLRNFRDEFLLSTDLGRDLVHFYYRHSPAVAQFIGDHEYLKYLTRGVLATVVLTIDYPWQTAFAIFIAALALVKAARRLQDRHRAS